MKLRLWVLAAIVSTLAPSLRAQSPGKEFEISPLVGHLFGGRIEDIHTPSSVPPFDHIRVSVADDATYGFRLGYSLPSGLEPDIQWSQVETHLRATPPGISYTPIRLNYYLAGLTYNFTQTRIRPYASLGFGAAVMSVEPFPIPGFHAPSDVGFTGEAAIGVKVFVTPWLAVRGEVRGYASKLGDFPFGICQGEFLVPVECQAKSWLVNADVGGGLVFAF